MSEQQTSGRHNYNRDVKWRRFNPVTILNQGGALTCQNNNIQTALKNTVFIGFIQIGKELIYNPLCVIYNRETLQQNHA